MHLDLSIFRYLNWKQDKNTKSKKSIFLQRDHLSVFIHRVNTCWREESVFRRPNTHRHL